MHIKQKSEGMAPLVGLSQNQVMQFLHIMIPEATAHPRTLTEGFQNMSQTKLVCAPPRLVFELLCIKMFFKIFLIPVLLRFAKAEWKGCHSYRGNQRNGIWDFQTSGQPGHACDHWYSIISHLISDQISIPLVSSCGFLLLVILINIVHTVSLVWLVLKKLQPTFFLILVFLFQQFSPLIPPCQFYYQ